MRLGKEKIRIEKVYLRVKGSVVAELFAIISVVRAEIYLLTAIILFLFFFFRRF